MKEKLKILHRNAVKNGNFYLAKIVFNLLLRGEFQLERFPRLSKILELLILADLTYDLIITTDNKIIWRSYELYRKSTKNFV